MTFSASISGHSMRADNSYTASDQDALQSLAEKVSGLLIEFRVANPDIAISGSFFVPGTPGEDGRSLTLGQ